MLMLVILMVFIFFVFLILFFMNILISSFYFLNRSKNTSFECGFEYFESVRLPFSIQFYIIGVLFLVFDIEVVYLFPMLISTKVLNYMIWLICSLMILFLLYLGLEYEKNEGLLKWYI